MVTSLRIQNKSLPHPILFKGVGYSVVIPGRAVDFTCQIPTENALEDISILLNNVPSLEVEIIEDGEGIPIPTPDPPPEVRPYIGDYTPVVLKDEDYKGVWDASSGSAPHLDPEAGWYWRVSVSGDYNLDGIDDWTKGDFVKWTGTLWMKAVGLAGYKSLFELLATIDTDETLSSNLDSRISSQKAVKAYVDSQVLGLLDDRGSYDASANVFPETGGSGPSGEVKKGDIWYISVPGELGGVAVTVGATVRALSDDPGQIATNWSILEHNVGYVPENVANKDTDETLAGNSDEKYPSQKAVKSYADTKVSHSLAVEADDFLVASGIGAWVKKTLAEVKTILGLGSAAYTGSGDYAPIAHVGAGGNAHANAVASETAGFMSGSDKAKLDGVAESANNYTHPNHSGDVTSSGDGAQTIANRAVTLAKMAAMATASFLGRNTEGDGDPEVLSASTARSILNVADGANNYTHPNHSGDVTSSGDGAQTIANKAVTLSKMADMATGSFLGRHSEETGSPEVLSAETALAMLGIGSGITAAEDTETTTLYPVMVAAAGSAQAAKVRTTATALSYNALTGVLAAGGFSGPLTGNVTGNCSGSSGSCTGNAATASSCSGNAATVTGFSPTSGKTLTVQKSITLTCADDTAVITLPAGTKTLVATDGNISGSSGSCTGNAATASSCSGNAATVTGFSPTSGKTLTVQKSITLTCADDTAVITLPAGTKTLVATDGNISGSSGSCTGNAATSSSCTGNAATSSSCSGNAATATKLANARTIGGVSFDGSANINLPGVNTAGNQNTSGSSASCTGNAATSSSCSGNAASASVAATVSGTSCSQNGDGWWRSTGATGWYNTTYAVGIYATEAGNVRTFNGANFISAAALMAVGNVTAYYSDERLKDFWGKIPNAVKKIMALNGYYFTENDTAKKLGYKNDRLQVGLSAQEVEKVFPEVVTDSPIGHGYKTLWYEKFTPLFIEAIKEQQAQIDALRATIKGLVK